MSYSHPTFNIDELLSDLVPYSIDFGRTSEAVACVKTIELFVGERIRNRGSDSYYELMEAIATLKGFLMVIKTYEERAVNDFAKFKYLSGT